MRPIGEILNETEHIPKCHKSEENNLYYIIKNISNMKAFLTFYDNGISLEVGENIETGNTFFEIKLEDDKSCLSVDLDKEDIQILISYLEKVNDMS